MRRTGAYALLFIGMAAGSAGAKTIVVEPGEGTPLLDAVAQAEDGDTIVIKEGTYQGYLEIAALTDVTVVGKGRPVIDAGNASDVFVATNCVRLTVKGITFRGGNPGEQGMDIRTCTDVLLTGCTVEQCPGTAIQDNGSEGVRIQKCIVSDCGQGILLSPGATSGTSGIVVSRNRITGVAGDAIRFAGDEAVVDRNVLEDVGSAVTVDPQSPWSRARIDRNRITNATGTAIRLSGSAHVVTRNRIEGAGSEGIEVEGEAMDVSRNRVAGIGNAGVFVSGGTGHTIEGNALEGCDVGLDLGGEGGDEVRANRVSGSVTDGVQIYAGGNFVESNKVKSSGRHGFHLQAAGNTLRRNRASGSGTHDLHSTVGETANTFDGNRFGTTSFP